MATYTRRLAAAAPGAAGDAILLTVPATGTYVVRDVSAVHFSLARVDALFQLYIAGAAQVTIASHMALTAYEVFRWDGRQVLLPGELLVANMSAAPWSVVVTGYVFD